jgi:hypothetical protein
MPQSGDITSLGAFFVSAFGHTRLAVQALSVIAFVALVYLARETIRAISSLVIPTRN